MSRIKTLSALLGLILLPIIANVIMLVFYAFTLVLGLFMKDKDFYEVVDEIKNSLAKLN